MTRSDRVRTHNVYIFDIILILYNKIQDELIYLYKTNNRILAQVPLNCQKQFHCAMYTLFGVIQSSFILQTYKIDVIYTCIVNGKAL